jgi:hypothetical protein
MPALSAFWQAAPGLGYSPAMRRLNGKNSHPRGNSFFTVCFTDRMRRLVWVDGERSFEAI